MTFHSTTTEKGISAKVEMGTAIPPLKPDKLVSILIPAYNSERWIEQTLQCVISQSWPNKEIIVVDDGSTDGTFDIARKYTSKTVLVVSQAHQGAAAARNNALSLSHGDFIQWMDADDLLAPDKIERQMLALKRCRSSFTLISGPWAHFCCRTSKAKFVPNPLWSDLAPVEWLLLKMGENCHMQTATWLVSRELTLAAGPWDTRLLGDDDGEYFCRVKMHSDGIIFIPEAKVYYREYCFNRLSFTGVSRVKQDALFLSIQKHIHYLRSMEDSERTRAACVRYLQKYMFHFFPERPDLTDELRKIASALGGELHEPHVSSKYAWIHRYFGWKCAKRAQVHLPRIKLVFRQYLDWAFFHLENLIHNSRFGKSSQ